MENKERYAGLLKHSKENNEFTKECLKKAMAELAQQIDYKEITVTMLCQKAGVSRMAFYRNYQVTSDVFYEIAYEMNTKVIEAVGSPFRTTTDRKWYLKTFTMLKENQEEMRLMFQPNFQSEWMKLVNGLAVYNDDFSPEKKYQRIMWCGGFENAISYWLNSGMKETPEEMADFCFTYLPHLLQEKKRE